MTYFFLALIKIGIFDQYLFSMLHNCSLYKHIVDRVCLQYYLHIYIYSEA